MKIFTPTLALALPFCLSGCVTKQIQATSNDGQVRQFTDAELDRTPRCPLRVCLMERAGFMWNAVAKKMSQHFSDVQVVPLTKGGSVCDVGIDFTNANGDHSAVYSGFTGERLANIDAHFVRATKIICALFDPTQPLGIKLAEQRLNAGLPAIADRANRPSRGIFSPNVQAQPVAPVPAPGLSAADIARIAKAVQGSAPVPPAPTPAASFSASPSPSFNAAIRPHDLAVIIGIETYSDIATKAPYAERDAAAFKAYVRALGVPERNIVYLTGSKAVRSALTKNIEGWLPRMAKPDSRVYFYFSGHGAPNIKTGQAYLVPWDGDPNFLKETAYPVAQLYRKLGALPAKQVLVAMDSCFSGAGGRSVLASGARPLVGKIDTGTVPAKITVLAASGASEISGSLDDKGHGAFTYFLLEGLNAGKTTPKALNEYLTPRVQDEARRLNRDQTPQLQGDGTWSLR